MPVEVMNAFFKLLALITVVATLLGIAALIAGRGAQGFLGTVRGAFHDHGLGAASAVTGVATLGSLYYSQVAHYPPCQLCWFQRIAVYPMAVILGVALLRHLWHSRGEGLPPPTDVWPHVMPLAIMGIPISIWHHMVQQVPALSEGSSCDPSSPCSAIYVDTFGFDLIPLGALITMTFVLVTALLARRGAVADDPDRPTPANARDLGAVRA